MKRTGKLSLLIAVMLLQLSLAGWSISPGQAASAAPAGPVMLSLSPADDLTNVPITADLKMTFDESVVKGSSSASISIYEYATSNLVEKISVQSNRVSIDTSQRMVTINPTNSFALNTDYYILIDAGSFANVSNGTGYAGIYSASIWNFRTVTVVDAVRPVHTLRTPAAGPVPVTTPVTITFDEPVYVASGNILVSSTEDVRSISVTSNAVTGSGTSQIVIQPPAALQPNTSYTVTIPNTAFQDAAGNLYQGASWSFTTDAAPVNVVDPLIPADNATSVSVNSTLTMEFDHEVQARAGKYIEIKSISNNTTFDRIPALSSRVTITNNQVRITPNSNFEANTGYYVLIDAGAFTQTDPNGDQWYHGISSASVWNFSTDPGNENNPPVVTAFSPANNGVVASLNTLLQMTFNEPIFPAGGTIDIRESTTGAVFRSIPITSERVTGGGTYQITIDPNKAVSGEAAKSFVNNTKYYVTIGNRAIRDAAGNYYAGISSSNAWTFHVTQDTVRPTLVSLSPVNNSAAVGLNETFSATFTEPVKKGLGSITFIRTGSGTASQISANFSVDGTNSRKINITPSIPFAANATYYVYMDASAVSDLADNSFAGILNEYQWTFRTLGSDTAAPTISKLQWSGSTITMTYNEALNPSIVPSAGSLYVTVNGAPRAISLIQVREETVILTLTSPIVAGQQVKLSYSKASPGLIQDISGNEAASINNQDVTGTSDTTVPILVSGSATGTAITLVFSKELGPVNPYAYAQFTVSIGGINYPANSISSTGSSIMLTLNGTIQNYQNIRVSYAPGAYPLRDTVGHYVNAFDNYNLYSIPDTSAPSLQAVSASGSVVTLRYNKSLNTSSVPLVQQYSVAVDNSARAVVQVSISGDSVFLTLSSGVNAGQTVAVSYLASITPVKDLAGNAAPSFNNVTNVSSGGGTGSGGGGGQSGLYGAVVRGSTLTLSFGDSLSGIYVPSTLQFLVMVNQSVTTVSRVDISGASAILALASPVPIGSTVTVTYYANASGLRTINGVTVNSFTNVTAANQTTIIDGLSGDYEASEGGGIGIKTSAASVLTDVSPAGVQAHRYTLNSEKVLTAFQTARSAGLANPRVAFKVPSTERAGIVAVSISTLQSAFQLNGNSVFAVQYGDAAYELQLDLNDFVTIHSLLNDNIASGQLLIRIDQGLSTLTNNISTKISSSNAQLLAGPYHFDVTVSSGSVQKPLNEFNGYVTRTIQTYQTVDTGQTSVVWFDPQTGALSYVPTELSTNAGKTTATFKRKGNSAYALVRNTSSFSDVSKHWAASSVHTMSRKFIVEGSTSTKFEPEKAVTRGEFATYIAKGLGLSGNKTAASAFKDVNANTSMGVYIGAASSAGIVLGNTDGTFRPNKQITRQEMAVMMMRAAKFAGVTIDLPQSTASYLQKFTDRNRIGGWAQADVAKAVYVGVINGKTASTMSPLTNATRAEGTVMLMRLLQKAKFLTP